MQPAQKERQSLPSHNNYPIQCTISTKQDDLTLQCHLFYGDINLEQYSLVQFDRNTRRIAKSIGGACL